MNNFQRKITDLYIYTIDFDVMLDFIKTPANLQVVGQSVGVSVTCTSILFFFFFHQTGFSFAKALIMLRLHPPRPSRCFDG